LKNQQLENEVDSHAGTTPIWTPSGHANQSAFKYFRKFGFEFHGIIFDIHFQYSLVGLFKQMTHIYPLDL